MRIVVIGTGQSLRGDDAAGLEAVRIWQKKYPDTAACVCVEIIELPGVGLLDLLDDADAVLLVDALHDPSPAGTLIHIEPQELESFTSGARSAHGWGVAETMQMGYVLDPKMKERQIILLGIVGSDFRMGAGISTSVLEALPDIADRIEHEIRKLLDQ